MSRTSGRARSSHHVTFSRRAFSEFTFQVAIRIFWGEGALGAKSKQSKRLAKNRLAAHSSHGCHTSATYFLPCAWSADAAAERARPARRATTRARERRPKPER